MQADGSAERVETDAMRDESASVPECVSWPAALDALLARSDLHPEARAALHRLTQADIDRLWDESQAEVKSWPAPMRSEHDVVACFIGWAVARSTTFPEHEEIAGRVRIEGEGSCTQVLVRDTRGRWSPQPLEVAADQVLRRIAQQAMRQALGPGEHGHPPYCAPELLHPEHEYPGMDRDRVQGWIKARAAKMQIQAGELVRQRMLRDPRSLGALQGAYRAPELLAKVAATANAAPELAERLWDLVRTAPMLARRQVYARLGELAQRIEAAQALMRTSVGPRLARQHHVPLSPVPNFEGELSVEAWVRDVLLAAGSAVENAFTRRGGQNVRTVLGCWLTIPGALAVARDPAFVAGPLFVGMRNCEAQEFSVLGNTLNDTLEWIRRGSGDEGARALLAMSFRDLYRLGEAMHEHARQQGPASPPASSVDALEPFFLDDQVVNGLELVELRTPQALAEEGRRLHHCVGDYWEESAVGGCRIISIRKEGRSRATCELALHKGSYVIAQLAGYRNREPATKVRRTMEHVRDQINRGDLPVAHGVLKEHDEVQRAMRTAQVGFRLDPQWLEQRLAPWADRPPLAIRRTRKRGAANEASQL